MQLLQAFKQLHHSYNFLRTHVPMSVSPEPTTVLLWLVQVRHSLVLILWLVQVRYSNTVVGSGEIL